jgi:hypothetical protein
MFRFHVWQSRGATSLGVMVYEHLPLVSFAILRARPPASRIIEYGHIPCHRTTKVPLRAGARIPSALLSSSCIRSSVNDFDFLASLTVSHVSGSTHLAQHHMHMQPCE